VPWLGGTCQCPSSSSTTVTLDSFGLLYNVKKSPLSMSPLFQVEVGYKKRRRQVTLLDTYLRRSRSSVVFFVSDAILTLYACQHVALYKVS